VSHAHRFPRKRGRTGLAMTLGLVAALGLTLFPGVADAAKGKKKNKNVTVMTRNLYLGSDLTPALQEGLQLGQPGHQDSYADAVGQVIQNVNSTDFGNRAISLANEVNKNRPDLVGLQEAALWRVQIPTDGTPLNPNGAPATTVTFDFVQQLLDQINKKAKSKKACLKKGIDPKSNKCFRGYRLVIAQDEFDFESFADFDHNNGPDGQTFDITASTGASDISKWLLGNDDTGFEFGEPPTPSFPTDANFDSGWTDNGGAYTGDPTGNTPDPNGGTDCPDTNTNRGPAFGESTTSGNWPFDGYDRDIDPQTPGTQTPVCVFHGIDLDGRLTMRDAIIARKGAGVKTKHSSSGHYNTVLQYTFGGQPLKVLRGFNQTDATVRGHKFHFVNTHLEAFDSSATNNPTNNGPVNRGQVRQAQAQQLIAGPLQSSLPVILVGDLNSNVPPEQSGDELAYQAILNAGFQERTNNPRSCCYQGELLNNPGDTLTHQVDHVMTNRASIRLKKAFQTTTFARGLWSSDHAGVGAILRFG
jgi:hypothetical protein